MGKTEFIQALKDKSITDIQSIPKSDLHSHVRLMTADELNTIREVGLASVIVGMKG